jgi:hypothetical protein
MKRLAVSTRDSIPPGLRCVPVTAGLCQWADLARFCQTSIRAHQGPRLPSHRGASPCPNQDLTKKHVALILRALAAAGFDREQVRRELAG